MCEIKIIREFHWEVNFLEYCHKEGTKAVQISLIKDRGEQSTNAPLPRREVYALGECPRKPSPPCVVCYKRGQVGCNIKGFYWEVFAVQSSIGIIFIFMVKYSFKYWQQTKRSWDLLIWIFNNSKRQKKCSLINQVTWSLFISPKPGWNFLKQLKYLDSK